MFHIITPCSRPNNLKEIYENIILVKKTEPVMWHICFDTNKVNENDRSKVKNELNQDWIRFYSASTDFKANPGKSQINFVLTHFHLGIFEHGFVYVLDDDNLLPREFFSYPYDEKESLIYLLPQNFNRHGAIRQPMPVVEQIDQGQIIIHSKVDHFYDLCYTGDGLTIQRLCKTIKYKNLIYPVTFYNKIDKTH